jgi:dCTP diphosphatase
MKRPDVTFTLLDDIALKENSKRPSSNLRSFLLRLVASVGNLCAVIEKNAPSDLNQDGEDDVISTKNETIILRSFWSKVSQERELIYEAIGHVFFQLAATARRFGLDFRECILKKIALNAKKYPVKLCKGKSGKYTDYSFETGITETNQSTLDIDLNVTIDSIVLDNSDDNDEKNSNYDHQSPIEEAPSPEKMLSDLMTIRDVSLYHRNFSIEREWEQYHTPVNILLALVGEVGELNEIFQWKGDERVVCAEKSLKEHGFNDTEIDKVSQELADVAIYCLRLSDVVGIEDLGAMALMNK